MVVKIVTKTYELEMVVLQKTYELEMVVKIVTKNLRVRDGGEDSYKKFTS